MSAPPARPGPGAHARGLFVAFHLLAVVLGALPAPEGGMSRSAWKDPTVQEELRAWAGRLRALGLAADDDAFQDGLWRVAVEGMALRRAALAPFAPYHTLLGTHQSWRMFVAPHTHPARLHIELQAEGAWRTLYVERDPAHAWMGDILDQDRVRSVIFRCAWPSYARAWEDLSGWLAREAAGDFPDGEALRLRFWKQRSPTPAEARRAEEPEGRWVRTQVHALAPLRASP